MSNPWPRRWRKPATTVTVQVATIQDCCCKCPGNVLQPEVGVTHSFRQRHSITQDLFSNIDWHLHRLTSLSKSKSLLLLIAEMCRTDGKNINRKTWNCLHNKNNHTNTQNNVTNNVTNNATNNVRNSIQTRTISSLRVRNWSRTEQRTTTLKWTSNSTPSKLKNNIQHWQKVKTWKEQRQDWWTIRRAKCTKTHQQDVLDGAAGVDKGTN